MTAWQKIKKFFSTKETITLIVSLGGGYLLSEVGKQGLSVGVVCVLVIMALICLVFLANEILSVNRFAYSVEDSVKSLEGKFGAQASKVMASIKELERKFSIEINYVERQTADSEVTMYQEFKKIVMRAEESILVVNSYLVEHTAPPKGTHKLDAERASKARDEYYDSLLKMAEGGKVEYKRVVQVKPDNSTLSELQQYNQVQIKHFRKMMEYMDRLPTKVVLKVAPAQRLSTFVLIDEKYLIWQINEILIQNKREDIRLHGAFLINDPQKEITTHFLQFYKFLEIQSERMNPEDVRVMPAAEEPD